MGPAGVEGRRGAESSAVSQVSWSRGAGFGIVAGIVVVVVITVLSFAELINRGGLGFYGTRGVGRVYFLFFLVFFWASHLGAVWGTSLQVFGAGSGVTFPALLYYIVPLLVLTWIGRRAALQDAVQDDATAVLQGASIALGYLLVVVGSFGLAIAIIGSARGLRGGELLQLFGIAGLVYPALLGGIGGLTVSRGGTDATTRGYGTQRTGTRAEARERHREEPRTQGAGPTPGGATPPAGQARGRPQQDQARDLRRPNQAGRQPPPEQGGGPMPGQAAGGGEPGAHDGHRGPTCPQCGSPIDTRERYCKNCGSPLH